jgi:hypothetical protein
MREQVGQCVKCNKTIYCLDGFLDGIVTEDKILYCFSCRSDSNEVLEE